MTPERGFAPDPWMSATFRSSPVGPTPGPCQHHLQYSFDYFVPSVEWANRDEQGPHNALVHLDFAAGIRCDDVRLAKPRAAWPTRTAGRGTATHADLMQMHYARGSRADPCAAWPSVAGGWRPAGPAGRQGRAGAEGGQGGGRRGGRGRAADGGAGAGAAGAGARAGPPPSPPPSPQPQLRHHTVPHVVLSRAAGVAIPERLWRSTDRLRRASENGCGDQPPAATAAALRSRVGIIEPGCRGTTAPARLGCGPGWG